MTDFGNYQFGIEVQDKFSQNTQKFRDELRNSLATYRHFRREIAKLSGESGTLNKNFRDIQNAAARTRFSFSNITKTIRDFNAETAKSAGARKAAGDGTRVEINRNTSLNTVLREQIVLLQRRNAELRTYNRLATTGGGGTGGPRTPRPLIDPNEPERIRKSVSGIRSLRDGLRNAATAGNQLQIPLARVLTAVFAITAFRAITREFKNLVKNAIQFNQLIETSRLGIAALFTAVGDVRDGFGGSVDAAQALALAGKEADRQVKLLQQDALDTVATFDQLLDTFQIAIAPGLTAGLQIDEVREFTVRISQAASALGVAQNQLAEEIRSVLSGTIQARTTRIAVALGITNEDIRKAREAGTLADFLNEKFAAFAVAGKEALNTFEGLRGRLADVLLQVTGLASADLFENLKGALRDIFDIISNTDDFGVLEPDPKVVDIFNAIFESINRVVTSGREALAALNFTELVEVARAFGEVLSFLGEVVVGLAQGAVQAVGTLKNLFQPLVVLFRTIAGSQRSVRSLVSDLVQILAIFFSLRTVLSAIGSLTSPLGLIAVAFGAIVIGLKEFLTESSGVEVTWSDVARFIGVNLVAAIRVAASVIRVGFNGALVASLTVLSAALTVFRGIHNILVATVLVGERLGAFTSEFTTEIVAQHQAMEKLNGEINQLAKSKAGEVAADGFKGIGDEIERAKGEYEKFFFDLNTKDLTVGMVDPESTRQIQTFTERLAAIPPIISTIKNAFQETDEEVRRLGDSSEKLADDLRLEESLSGVEGVVRDVITAIAEVRDESNRNLKSLFDAQAKNEAKLTQLAERREQQNLRLSTLTEAQAASVGFLVDNERELVDAERNVTALKVEQAGLESKIRSAKVSGQLEVAQALLEEKRGVESIIQAEESRIKNARELRDKLGAGVDESTLEIAAAEIALQGELNSANLDALIIEDQKTAAIDAQNKLIQQRSDLVVAQNLRNLQNELVLMQAEAAAAQNLNAALEQRGVAGAVGLAEAQNSLNLQRTELDLALQQRDLDIQALQLSIAKNLADGLNVTSQQQTLALLLAQRDAQASIGQAAIDELDRILERQRLIKEGNVFEGLREGALDFAEEFGSAFQMGVDLARNVLQSFAQEVSQTIVDALDPSKDVDIEERFAKFLGQILQQMIQQLAQYAIAKAIVLGAAQGGEIPNARTTPSPWHYSRPQGFARGGKPRPPRGIDRRDNIPIWVRAGEFVVRPEAVAKYGPRVMHAINRGMLDPSDLSGLLGRRSMNYSPMSRTPSFATGGLVSESLEAARENAISPTTQAQQRVVGAVVEASNGSMRRMLDGGGDQEMIRTVREQAGAFRAALGRSNIG